MKDFKIIATEDREFFEKKIKEYMELGYEMKHTNLSIALDTVQRITNIGANKLRLGFYAYMEKEN